ncbi:putative dipeptidyl peptidase IV [Microdochium trichocladiopsis]|uniref:Dipeptidyl peptidase IV n=1 Tax=Microdochium trichocladiopsis TaxID=1682393 RepID=A0A9P8Y4T5_9PEZI|nr:putative dipeptidyl peptidase IV [Microdochium trichocladiopsis]KAH7029055.1 putative dipeptidyl peptidase IV [Microdochium trichocladiopsis]
MATISESAGHTAKTVAPFGLWESEVTKEAVFQGTSALSSPRVCRRTGRAYFTESRPDGVNYIVEIKTAGPSSSDASPELKDVLPAGYNARSRVYEYGGGPYAILGGGSGGRLVFSNKADDSVNVLDADSGSVTKLVHTPKLRYGDFDAHPRGGDDGQPWVLAVEEDHAVSDVPEKVQNYVVAINTQTGEVKRLASGADLYMYPRFSLDGSKVCWVEWDFPDMPWSGVRLFWADWSGETGSLSNVEHVAGDAEASATEPRWGPDGYLYYCHETTDWRQIYRRRPGQAEATLIDIKGLEDVEFGRPTMALANNSYDLLSDKCLVAVYIKNGTSSIVQVNLDTFEYKDVSVPLADVERDGITRFNDNSFLAIGTGHTTPQALYSISLESNGKANMTTVRKSTTQTFDSAVFSVPEHIEFQSKKQPSRKIHGFYWPPHNPGFTGPEGQKPPLIVQSHGGPTSHTPPGLKLDLQYWNTRGYATFAINYSGSTGHGKAYRDSLNANWGVLDVDDVAEAVAHLAESGRTDGALTTGIRGGSAGGYSVLQALCCYPDIFAGGVCLYGISEVKLLLDETHKMECRYVDNLMFTAEMDAEQRAKVMHDRSPVYHAGNITAPLLILHGDEDNVVPISQAYTMYDDIKKRGGEVKLVKFEGEGHGFRKGENLITGQTEEEEWWKKTLVRK